MKRWLQIGIPLVAGGGAFIAMEPFHWDSIRSEAMLVLSVLAGAVLFRLGRGLPQVSIDHLEIDEAKKLAEAYIVVSRRLAYVAGVTAASLVGLAVIGVFHRFIVLYLPPDLVAIVGSTATAILAAVIAFAFCRAIELVLGDISTVAIQSDSIVKGVQRRQALEADKALGKAQQAQPFERPSNYGEIV